MPHLTAYSVPTPARWLILAVALFLASAASTADNTIPRVIPSRLIPVPDTVSPALQKLIARAPVRRSKQLPQTPQEWTTFRATLSKSVAPFLLEARNKFAVTTVPQMIGGIHCYVVTPRTIDPAHHEHLLLGVHGGSFIVGGGEAGLLEAIEMAGSTHIKTIAIDYRMPPEHPFPAALEDAIAVWRDVIHTIPPADIAVFGHSAGAALALSFVQRARTLGLPLPGAIIAGSPWADLSQTGDTYFTHAGVDNLLPAYEGELEAAARLYANGRDLKDPQLSPVYNDFAGFPSTFLVSGTRDLFLSNTVRVHHKLLAARVPTELEVEEGQSHTQYLSAAMEGAPEAHELYAQMASFLSTHLGHSRH